MAAKIVKSIFLFILLTFFTTACHVNGDFKNKEKKAKPQLNTMQLISRSLSKGEISRNEAALFKAYAVFDSEKLPAKFKSDFPQKDATMIIRQLKKEFNSLDEETKRKIKPYLFKRKGDK